MGQYKIYRVKILISFLSLFLGFSPVVFANCSDTQDDDNDGLVDWQYDLGCSGPNDETETADARDTRNANGWSTFDPTSDTRIIFVSSSDPNRNDTTCRPYTQAELQALTSSNYVGLIPCATINAAMPKIRALGNNQHNWLLVKRGDSFNEGFIRIQVSGRSPAERFVIATYGSSMERPLINAGSQTGFYRGGGGGTPLYIDNIALLGFAVQGTSAGIHYLGGGHNILIEDCKFTRLTTGVIVQNQDPNVILDNVEIRRNIIADSYSIGSHSQGIYTYGIDGLLIEENVIDHNGWDDTFPQHHNIDIPNPDLAVWSAVHDGQFSIQVDNIDTDPNTSGLQPFQISGVDFSGATSLSDVASRLQNAINTAVVALVPNRPNAVTVTAWFHSESNRTLFLYLSDNPNPGSAGVSDLGDYNGSANGTELRTEANTYLTPVHGANATIFNHNMYINTASRNVVIRNNISARASSHGLQLRPGGVAENNLFLANAIHGFISGAGGAWRNNVALYGRDITSGAPRGWGFTLNNKMPYAIMENNIVAHKDADVGGGFAYEIDAWGGPGANQSDPIPADSYTSILRNNIAYNWRGTQLNFWPGHYPRGYENMTIEVEGNHFQDLRSNSQMVIVATASPLGLSLPQYGLLTFRNNSYYTGRSGQGQYGNNWFSIDTVSPDRYLTNAEWVTHTSENSATFDTVSYPDPNRTIERYMQFIQEPQTTMLDFLMRARNLNKYNWDARFTAPVVNDYIREGFGRAVFTPPNAPPRVNAGPDRSIVFSTGPVPLVGTVTDDGPGRVNVEWTQTGGPAIASILDRTRATTSLTFSELGVYTFQLVANDGELIASDEIQITVGNQSLGNAASQNEVKIKACMDLKNQSHLDNPPICFQAPPDHVKVSIYTKKGELVRVLFDGDHSGGDATLIWDLKNDVGSKVASGIYTVLLESGGKKLKSKVVAIK
jgi:hypothetical protein